MRQHPHSFTTAAFKGGGCGQVIEIGCYLTEGGLFLFVLIIQCNDDGYNQSNQGYCKPRKTDHQRQYIFYLHRHHLLTQETSRPPIQAILLL